MTVGEVCNREVVFVLATESVVEAARLMRQHHVGDLVVVEEREGRRVPVGIVTDRDLVLEVLAAEIDPNKLTAGDVMSDELVTAREEDSLFDTIERLRAHGIRRLPVVDREGSLVGILTVDDLIELLAEIVSHLAALLERERMREKARRR
jgi:CBS domain-containing protein